MQYVFQGLSSVAYNTYGPCCSDTLSHDRSDQLKGIIRDYFRNDYPKDIKLEIDVNINGLFQLITASHYFLINRTLFFFFSAFEYYRY